jgi:predicted metalloprotease with PDZ domain
MGLRSSSLPIPGGSTYGLQVLRVQEGSPGQKAGLRGYFDYFISINGIRLDEDDDKLKATLQEYTNRSVDILVYNSKMQTLRQVSLIPNETWGGQV